MQLYARFTREKIHTELAMVQAKHTAIIINKLLTEQNKYNILYGTGMEIQDFGRCIVRDRFIHIDLENMIT